MVPPSPGSELRPPVDRARAVHGAGDELDPPRQEVARGHGSPVLHRKMVGLIQWLVAIVSVAHVRVCVPDGRVVRPQRSWLKTIVEAEGHMLRVVLLPPRAQAQRLQDEPIPVCPSVSSGRALHRCGRRASGAWSGSAPDDVQDFYIAHADDLISAEPECHGELVNPRRFPAARRRGRDRRGPRSGPDALAPAADRAALDVVDPAPNAEANGPSAPSGGGGSGHHRGIAGTLEPMVPSEKNNK